MLGCTNPSNLGRFDLHARKARVVTGKAHLCFDALGRARQVLGSLDDRATSDLAITSMDLNGKYIFDIAHTK